MFKSQLALVTGIAKNLVDNQPLIHQVLEVREQGSQTLIRVYSSETGGRHAALGYTQTDASGRYSFWAPVSTVVSVAALSPAGTTIFFRDGLYPGRTEEAGSGAVNSIHLYDNVADFPVVGESGHVYGDLQPGNSYRLYDWNGLQYVQRFTAEERQLLADAAVYAGAGNIIGKPRGVVLFSASRTLTAADDGNTAEITADGIVLTLPRDLPAGFSFFFMPKGTTIVRRGDVFVYMNGVAFDQLRIEANNPIVGIQQMKSNANHYRITGA